MESDAIKSSAPTIASIVACGVLLWKLSTKRLAPGQKPGVMGHVWDENLEEFNNPLPRWWMWLFWITLAFGVIYLVLYPGLGSFAVQSILQSDHKAIIGFTIWTGGLIVVVNLLVDIVHSVIDPRGAR